jgi:hypothetical protein
MSETENPRDVRTPEDAWLSLEKEQGSMHIALTPDQLCAMAHSREKLNRWLVPAVTAIAAAIAIGLLYNVFKIDQPWIRVGQAWTLGVLAYLFAIQRRNRRGVNEPCVRFLEGQHEGRRIGYLSLQRRLFLFIPGIVACWWGRPSLAGTAGSWPFLIIATALVALWFAFGAAANKAMRDRDELVRCMSAKSSD